MSFRGRGGYGRGGGRGGRGGGGFQMRAPDRPYPLFPDIELPKKESVTIEEVLILKTSSLSRFWKSSPYFINSKERNESEKPDMEKYSDTLKPRAKSTSDDIWQFMQRTNMSFPLELIEDGRVSTRPLKKARWNPDADLQKLDVYAKHETIYEEREAKGDNDEKEGENEEEGEEEVEDDEEELSDDYNQNNIFDDDEDDYNDKDDHDDEPYY